MLKLTTNNMHLTAHDVWNDIFVPKARSCSITEIHQQLFNHPVGPGSERQNKCESGERRGNNILSELESSVYRNHGLLVSIA